MFISEVWIWTGLHVLLSFRWSPHLLSCLAASMSSSRFSAFSGWKMRSRESVLCTLAVLWFYATWSLLLKFTHRLDHTCLAHSSSFFLADWLKESKEVPLPADWLGEEKKFPQEILRPWQSSRRPRPGQWQYFLFRDDQQHFAWWIVLKFFSCYRVARSHYPYPGLNLCETPAEDLQAGTDKRQRSSPANQASLGDEEIRSGRTHPASCARSRMMVGWNSAWLGYNSYHIVTWNCKLW